MAQKTRKRRKSTGTKRRVRRVRRRKSAGTKRRVRRVRRRKSAGTKRRRKSTGAKRRVRRVRRRRSTGVARRRRSTGRRRRSTGRRRTGQRLGQVTLSNGVGFGLGALLGPLGLFGFLGKGDFAASLAWGGAAGTALYALGGIVLANMWKDLWKG